MGTIGLKRLNLVKFGYNGRNWPQLTKYDRKGGFR